MERISFERLMEKLVVMPEVIETELIKSLRDAAVQVQKTAVAKFGSYQSAYGEFEAWAVLAPATIQKKLRAGSADDDPLIGHYPGKAKSIYPTALRQSISISVDDHQLLAYVGTNDPVGEWQEFGHEEFNVHFPPRPFLRPALYQNQDSIKKSMEEALGLGLMKWF